MWIRSAWSVSGSCQVLSEFGPLAFPDLSKVRFGVCVPQTTVHVLRQSLIHEIFAPVMEGSTLILQSEFQVPRLHAAPIVGLVVLVNTRTFHPAIQSSLSLSSSSNCLIVLDRIESYWIVLDCSVMQHVFEQACLGLHLVC